MISNTHFFRRLRVDKILALLFLLLGVGVATACHQSEQTQTIIPNQVVKVNTDSFDLKLKIEKIDEDEYYLVATIELDSEAYIVSPYSLDDTYLHFNIFMTDTTNVIVADSILERPKAVEEFDPILKTQVRFVRQKTVYKKKLKAKTNEDFELSGLVEFLLEPRCIPYNIGFLIEQQTGEVKIKSTTVGYHPSYKGGN